MAEEKQAEVVELAVKPGELRAVHLSRPDLSGYSLGEGGSFVLRTALFGLSRVELYETVSGTDRYPPGRIAKVSLDYDELERLVDEYGKHKAAMEEVEAKRKAEQAVYQQAHADDFDPFLDSADLP